MNLGIRIRPRYWCAVPRTFRSCAVGKALSSGAIAATTTAAMPVCLSTARAVTRTYRARWVVFTQRGLNETAVSCGGVGSTTEVTVNAWVPGIAPRLRPSKP